MISIDQLSFAYASNEKKVIQGMTFEINEGEIFGFLGPSGAGKTTTQRLIIGLLKGYEGSINILGKERSRWQKDIFEHIGVAFDFPNLYLKLTAEENLKLMQMYYRDQSTNIEKLLKEVDLLKDRNTKVEHFSKGMKMRLNFVRAILHNPQIVFFDEPTSGLDPVNAKMIKDMILNMKSMGKTVFLTTHNMTVAEQLCDKVAFINEGQISAIDSPKNFMIHHGEKYINAEFWQDGMLLHEKFSMNGLYENEKFQNLLKSNALATLHSKEASLEEVFIHFTGRELL